MKLQQNTRYQATVNLAGVELLASNNMVADKFKSVGFKDVKVVGSGSKRTATGTWPGKTQDVEIPKQISQIKKV